MAETLHVRYRRSGGIAGIDMAAEAEEPDLPAEAAQVATGLLAGPANPSMSEDRPSRGADQFTYTLELERGGDRRTFRWSDTTVPEGVRPLLDSLAERSEPTP